MKSKKAGNESVLRKAYLESWQPEYPDSRLWKNYTGVLYTHRGSRVSVGIPPPRGKRKGGGGSDLIGFETVIVTPEMIGQRLAVFTVKELKAYKDTLKYNQGQFLTLVYRMGGYASIIWESSDGTWNEVKWNPEMIKSIKK